MLTKKINNEVRYTLVALALLLAPLFCCLHPLGVSAAPLEQRSIRVGSSVAAAITTHRFQFRIVNPISLGSIEFEYCTNSPFVGGACTAPTGFSLTNASLTGQTGATGFTIHPNTTTNKLILGRGPAAVAPPVNATYTIANVNNPSQARQTVFVRISTFASNNGTGARGETGTVVFSTARGLSIGGFVPPYLIFCVANTVNANCTITEGNYLSFGELSPTTTQAVTSQFAVATNDPAGYVTTVSGVTLTSGNNVIPALTSATPSTPGVSQFGINLKANTTPTVGSNPSGVGTGVPQPNYNTTNSFAFNSGNLVISTLPSDFNVFTVSYIANVSSGQPPGVYSSTITYITTVLF